MGCLDAVGSCGGNCMVVFFGGGVFDFGERVADSREVFSTRGAVVEVLLSVGKAWCVL